MDSKETNLKVLPGLKLNIRLPSVDVVKAIAIVLVVYGHVTQGMARRNLMNLSFFNFTDTLVYSFHMAAFFFVSGLFTRLGSNTSSKSLVEKKVMQLLWPYLLWELINILLYPFISKYTMSGHQPLRFSTVLISVALGKTSWFLWTLFMVNIVGIVTRNLDKKLLLIASVIVYGIVSYYKFGMPDSVIKIFTMLPYFVIGSRWADEIIAFLLKSQQGKTQFTNIYKIIAVVLLIAFLLGSTVVEVNWIIYRWPLVALKLIQGLAGTLLLLIVAEFIVNMQVEKTLVKIGVASLAIFLLHPYFQVLARIMCSPLMGKGGAATAFVIIFQTLVAAVCPVVIYYLTLRYGGFWLFQYPKKAKPDKSLLGT
jgi:fucose 4-O-acetylase-like acetyltransferase